MQQLRGWMTAGAFSVVLLAAVGAPAQTLTTLASFDGTNGAEVASVPVQGSDGNFYGTTYQGGVGAQVDRCPAGGNTCGVVFRVAPDGVLSAIYDFCAQDNCADGSGPTAGLVVGLDGNFYGTTAYGGTQNLPACGTDGCGTIFRITPEGTLTTLHKFDGTDGAAPALGSLLQGSDGNFYGTTSGGGTGAFCKSYLAFGCGTVFRISPDGTFIRLYDFCAEPRCADGASPFGGLTQGADGNFYGTTVQGGSQNVCPGVGGDGGCGTIFKITSNGHLSILFRFTGSDGAGPFAALVQGNDGFLYGSTKFGGIPDCDGLGCGTLFKTTIGGKLTTLIKFSPTDGCCWGPQEPLVLATDGNFYGTAFNGGSDSNGGIFKLTPEGELTMLYSSSIGDPGPAATANGLTQGTDGSFYGTTTLGGTDSLGSVFNLSVGLGAFVESIPGSGVIGRQVAILGNDLSGATGVLFNGTAATFNVVSATEITATIPAGATTGGVVVITPSSTLSSNKEFRVLPQITSFTPTSGPPGTTVVITGKSLTQATAVSLACKWPMTFTVDSDTQITATIPADGTTGGIGIQTKGGHVESVGNFSVTQ